VGWGGGGGTGEVEEKKKIIYFKKSKSKKIYLNNIENIKRIYCEIFLDKKLKSSFVSYV
jgi:hypothetical protein